MFPPVTYIYIKSVEQLENIFLEDLKEYKKFFVGKRMLLGFDTETYWTDDRYKLKHTEDGAPLFIETDEGTLEGNDRLFMVGLDPTIFDRQYLIDTHHVPKEDIIRIFKPLFEKEAILIGHYLKYDLGCLAKKYGIYPEEVRCTETIARRLKQGDKLTRSGAKSDFKLSTLYSLFIDWQIFKTLTGMTPEEYEDFKHKNQKSNWKKDRIHPSQLQYGSDDIRLIFYLYKAILEKVKAFIKKYPQSGLINIIKIECAALVELAIIETAGVAADVNYQENVLIPYLENKLKEAEDKLALIPECWIERIEKKVRTKKKVKYTEEILSTQLARFHYSPDLIKVLKNLGYNKFQVSKKGNESCDKNAFNEIFWRCQPGPKRDILAAIYQYRKAATYLSKNGYNQLQYVHSNGRLHPTYFPLAAQTGRMASVNPASMTVPSKGSLFGDLDENGEEIDGFSLCRPYYKASPGMEIVDADWSNQEVRIAAEATGDPVITQAFKNDEDLHQITADSIGVSRDIGKLFFLSVMNKAFENRIIQYLYEETAGRVDYMGRKDDVTLMRNTFFETYVGLAEGQKKAEELVEAQLRPFESLAEFANRKPLIVGFDPFFKSHELWCLSADQERIAWAIKKGEMEDIFHKNYKVKNPKTGKISTWGNEWNQTLRDIATELWNFWIQGTGSVMLKMALSKIGKTLREKGFDPYKDGGIRLVVHDEIATECKKDLVPIFTEVMKDGMIWAESQVLKKVPCKISCNFGSNWREASP